MVHFPFQSKNKSITCCQQVVASKGKKGKKGENRDSCLHNIQITLPHQVIFLLVSLLYARRHCMQYNNHLQAHHNYLTATALSRCNHCHSCACGPVRHTSSFQISSQMEVEKCKVVVPWHELAFGAAFSIGLGNFMAVLFS